jgi:Protein of unknown function (DUF4038)/Putative collagen-binding domain of a collagenase
MSAASRLPIVFACASAFVACGSSGSSNSAPTDGGGGDATPFDAASDGASEGAPVDANIPDGADAQHDGSSGDSGSGSPYPLRASGNGRYLVTQQGAPFLLTGDAPQALIANVSLADAKSYFADRASLGFNAGWVNLLCDTYTAGNADGTTYDGLVPFVTPDGGAVTADQYDITQPNEAYFARVDAMVEIAAQYGIVVFLDPIETGGWLATLRNDGVAAATTYGTYLGNRYSKYDNLVWLSGNDFQTWMTASDDALVSAVAIAIKKADPRHLQTIELSYNNSSSTDDPTWVPIVGLDAAYTYYPTYAQVLHSYNRTAQNPMPVFLVESTYDNENLVIGHTATTQDLRMEEYWTMLSGGTGLLYGNHYTWTFTTGWQQNLDTPGAHQIAYLRSFFTSRAWQDLVPDQGHAVVTAGYGTFDSNPDPFDTSDYVTTAKTPDGKLAVSYLPTGGTVTVDMSQLTGTIGARWYDPGAGTYAPITGSPFPNQGTRMFTSPGNNKDGDPDWVLVLEAQ